MRFRLGLLQDTAAIEKQIAKDAAEAKKQKTEPPTVKTEAQMKADEASGAKEKESIEKAPKKKIKIRPLSEAKAIDLGANFVSESFLFVVGVGLIVFEQWRRSRQEKKGREDVADRLNELEERDKSKDKYYGEALSVLEKEVVRLRGKGSVLPGSSARILPEKPAVLQDTVVEEDEKPKGWLTWIQSRTIGSNDGLAKEQEAEETGKPSQSNGAETSTASQPSQPSPSIIDRVRQRTHPRDVTLDTADSSSTEILKPSPSGSKPA